MNDVPKVTVILTSFNHSKYLREAIDSVLLQTYENYELIIWDDASTDNSWEIIQSYADSRIRAFKNPKRMYGGNVNRALEVAQGEYIAIHHSDDVWEPEKLHKQVSFLDEHQHVGAVFTNALAIGEEGKPLTDESHFYYKIFDQPNRTRHEWLRHFFEKGNALCHPSVLIRKRCYQECGLYRYGFAQVGDFDMWIRLAFKYDIHVLPDKLVHFRVRDNEANTSGNRPETRSRGLYEYSLLLNHYLQLDTIEDLVKVFPEARKYCSVGKPNIRFALAMAILEIKPYYFAIQFALNILFKVINDSDSRSSLEFDTKDLIKLTGELDPLQVLRLEHLNHAVSERDGQIASLSHAVSERDGQIASLSQAVSERDGQIASLSQAVSERDGQIASLTDETVRRGEWPIGLDLELNNERTKILAMTNSNSWRITRPLREIRRWLSSPKEQASRYAVALIKMLKRNHHKLPLSYKAKRDIYRTLCMKFPQLSGLNAGSPPIFNYDVLLSLGHDDIQNRTSLNEILNRINSIRVDQNPLVSVIIPVFGKIEFTLNCLSSIADNLPKETFEIIVVDDCSPDNTATILSKVKGVRLLLNENNQGFIRSCNIGAKAAKGQYLYFLNNDTAVTAGWLDELLCTFSKFPGTGLVGSKLIYPDGRLQEAGGIIWQDGSAWNFGRFQDPQLPVYNYAREVDYSSGASIMVPKSLFEELGGFDEHYLPAYCEDSDLALKIRDKGYRVIYQPLSTVIHYEGITSGTDTTQGTKAYQVENSKKLFERWQQRLQFHEAPGIGVDNAKDRRATRRVLVLDHCTPTPNQDAGSVTVFNLLLLLREMDFQVTFIPEDNFLYLPDYTTALQRSGIEVLYAPYVTSVKQHLKESGERYELAFLFRPGVVERHVQTLRKYCPNAKVLFHTVDLHYLRMSREAQLLEDKSKQKAAEDMKQREFAAIRAADACIVHSTAELEILKPLLPEAKLHVFPLIMDVKGSEKTLSERRDIVFVGGYQHTPNVDAVQYFVKDVMPLLREQLPGVRFYAVGSKPPAEIQALASEDVIITGFVEDLNPLLDKMRVSVAPLRYGAGIKGKIGTAMAVGLPVVATSLATEGMSLTDGENILVADGSEAFANAVARIYRDEILWHSLSQNGLAFADRAWGAEAAWGTLSGILSELGFTPARNKRGLILYASNSQGASENKKQDLEKPTMEPNDDYRKKIQQELAIYEKQINVHDLPDIYHYWSNKYLAPIFRDAGFSTIAEFFSSNLLAAARRAHASSASFVSVGAGNCDLEVAIAKNLVNAGLDNFTLECLEINPVMLERGKEIAKENGVLKNMLFVEADFNTWIPGKHYDGVMANQSLHHVVQLEHLFDQVKNALHENGSFVISDMVGRNGHQRWPEALEIVNRFWKELPESKKFNVLLNRIEKEYDNWDCSKEGFEGIRAQDILPLLVQKFQCEKFVGFGNVIDVFVDRCFGHNFNRDSQEDRDLIDRVHAEDEAGFASGCLKPTHMMAVFVKILHCAPYYSRGITPVAAIRNPDL